MAIRTIRAAGDRFREFVVRFDLRRMTDDRVTRLKDIVPGAACGGQLQPHVKRHQPTGCRWK